VTASMGEVVIGIDSSKCPPGRNKGVVELYSNDPNSPRSPIMVEVQIVPGTLS